MKSFKATVASDGKVDLKQVENLCQHFLDVIEATLNTVDHIADVNSENINNVKYIKAAIFRMNLRKLKVQLTKDLKFIADVNPSKEPKDAS